VGSCRYTETSGILVEGGTQMMTEEELDKYSQYFDRDRLIYMDRQQRLFDEARPKLLETYLNQYVAFEDGQVLDHDGDRVELAKRIYAKYGYRDLIMQRVTLHKPVYYIGGFRILRDSAS
jgi:hypothetical protein